ncbi:MAG: HAD-IC family P-type ATPase, partial [Oscillospiraceae bacterium]|nr:HAD-IC family P-type ATPase [Oscillospiraceae bacterium]
MAYFFDFEQDYTGLDPNRIDDRLSMYGLNTYTKLPDALKSAYASVLLSPSVLLMFIAGVLCFFGMGIGAGIVTLLLTLLYVFAELYFRKKSDEQLDEIEASTAMKFRVIRGGKLELVEKEFIVPEDLIVVQAGERVPADAFILESRDLTVDECIFTGNKQPAPKYAGAISKSSIKPTFVYSGSNVLSGVAICKVSATGVDTKLYQQRGEIKERHPYYTELEKFVRSNIPICSVVGVALTLFLTIFKIVNGGEVVPSALNGITVGLCFIPTGVASMIRLYYTKGAMKMIKSGALMKSFADIEKLNSLTVLCVEKEGAISKNSLEVRGVYARSEELLYKVAALAFDRNTADPAERALMVKAAFFDENISNVYKENEFIEKIPDIGGSISGAVWVVGGEKICCVKGTPEQILPMCRIGGDTMFEVKKKYESYYANGCSVMAIACVDANSYKADVTAGFSYTFVGLIAFSAPLRDSVSSAVKTCRRSGVRIVMLTEDNPSAAASTGSMIGLSMKSVVTGEQIEHALKTGEAFELNSDIYAKVTPEQKVYIINKLKSEGEVVAMTGTRTGDADVLAAADVGITIAQHATGSTYEASDIVMNDDNFLAIADTIARARQIHRNIKRAVSVLFSGYIGMILLTVINIFCDLDLMLTPSITALITMVILPLVAAEYFDCSADMRSNMPPSEFVSERKINFRYIGKAALFGALSGVAATASYMFMYNSTNVSYARSCSVISFIICTMSFVVMRFSSSEPFKTFWSAPLVQRVIPAALTV